MSYLFEPTSVNATPTTQKEEEGKDGEERSRVWSVVSVVAWPFPTKQTKTLFETVFKVRWRIAVQRRACWGLGMGQRIIERTKETHAAATKTETNAEK